MNLAEAGQVIRLARKKAGKTQEMVAKARGMSRSTLSKIETGVIPEIGLRKYLKLCDSLGLSFMITATPKRPTLSEAYAKKQEEQAAAAKETDAILKQL